MLSKLVKFSTNFHQFISFLLNLDITCFLKCIGSGFYCEVYSIKISHEPHMTIFYNEIDKYLSEPQGIHYGILQIADTRSIDQRQWLIVN